MKISILATILGLGAILSGCASPTWDKPGATQQDFAQDSYACEKDMRQSGYYGGGIIGVINANGFEDRCMVAHGWTQVSASTAPSRPEEFANDAAGQGTRAASYRSTLDAQQSDLPTGSANSSTAATTENCTAQDKEIARLAVKNGYQTSSNCH
jgi:hypothetical protein